MNRSSPACFTVNREKIRSRGHASRAGQDACALAAFAHLLELYAAADQSGARDAVIAMKYTLSAMRVESWPLARRLISEVLEDDTGRLWFQIEPVAPREPRAGGGA